MSTICLGMLLGIPHLEMVSWGVFIVPQHKTSCWRKVAAFCSTPESPVRSLDGPVLLAVGLSQQVTVGAQAFYTGQSKLHIGQSGGLFSTVPPRTSR
jgi:hypothetical protein